ncbi:YtfJ family protein [Sulfurimonas aquatica]|nr:YtfJ family protein [Sulfurimonas aquatica]
MKLNKVLTGLLLGSLISLNLNAVTIGQTPKLVSISDDNGGLVEDGSVWSSSIITDKVYVMFYVDPDEKDVNEHFSQALKAKEYDKSRFGSMAIINLAATWKPNFVIEKILKGKQEEFPRTIYVKDKSSVLVKEWELADDASNILLFASDGKLLFYKSGKMQEDDMNKVFKLIEDNI